MQTLRSRIIRYALITAWGCLLCSCGTTQMPSGTYKSDGSLSIGAEPLNISNQKNIIDIIQKKKITQLEELRRYLETSTHGRGKIGRTRYDIWHYTSYSVDLNRNNFCMLAVESEGKIIKRMAYMTSSESKSAQYYGDAELAQALAGATVGRSCISPLNVAFKQVEKRRKPLVKDYLKMKPKYRFAHISPTAGGYQYTPAQKPYVAPQQQTYVAQQPTYTAPQPVYTAPQQNYAPQQKVSRPSVFSKFATALAVGAMGAVIDKHASNSTKQFINNFQQSYSNQQNAAATCTQCGGQGLLYNSFTGASTPCPSCQGQGGF